jgi:hypothetical protein
VGEVVAGIGFIVAVVLIPFSQSGIASGREAIRISIPRGTLAGCTFQLGDRTSQSGGSGAEAGGFSIGPINLRAAGDVGNVAPKDVSIRDREGTVTIVQPASAARALAYVSWPLILNLLCTGATGLVILDLLRRMLGSIARREVFTAQNARNVSRLGILFVISSVAKMLLAGWLVNRFAAFAALILPQGASPLETVTGGDRSGIGIGLMILVLAGVFRQGLALKEDSQLTI